MLGLLDIIIPGLSGFAMDALTIRILRWLDPSCENLTAGEGRVSAYYIGSLA